MADETKIADNEPEIAEDVVSETKVSPMTVENPRPTISQPAAAADSHQERIDPIPSVWDIYYPSKVNFRQDSIYVASFPQIVIFWPTALALFLGGFLQLVGVNPATIGWGLACVVFFNFLPLVQDFDQKKFLILLLSVFAFVLMIWILNLYGFSFFQTLGSWILSFQPKLDTDAYFILGSILLFLLSWGMLGPLFSYWKFEQNEFVHFTRPIGKDMSISRIGCTVYKDVPDVLECLLTFGGGSIVIRRDNQVIATIENVPFLRRRMEAIEEMLSETKVVIDQS